MPEAALSAATAAVTWWSAARVAARWTGGGGWPRAATAVVLLGTVAAAVSVLAGLSGLGTSAGAIAALTLAYTDDAHRVYAPVRR